MADFPRLNSGLLWLSITKQFLTRTNRNLNEIIMKKRDKLQIATTLLLYLLIVLSDPLFAGEKSGSNLPATKKITVIDALGREVTIDGPVKTCAWTNYSTPVVLKILNAWDKVVGGGPYVSDSGLYPGFENITRIIPDIYHQYQPNMEVLIELNPDLLILEVIPMPGLPEFLEKWGDVFTIVTVKATDYPDGMRASYKILGKLLDREAEAEAYIDWVDKLVARLVNKTNGLTQEEKTSYFFKTSPGPVDYFLTFTNEMPTFYARDVVTGGHNIAGELPSAQKGYIQGVDLEWIAEQDYDVLLVADAVPGAFGPLVGDSTLAARRRDAVMALPAFAGSRAVREGRVFVMSELFAGANLVLSMPYFAKIFYPKLFADLDPVAIHQEYYTRFFRADVDIRKTGVFVYPMIP